MEEVPNAVVSEAEIEDFIRARKNPDVLRTGRPRHLGKECWWYAGGLTRVYGVAVAGFYTVRGGRRYYSYVIATAKGLRRAEHPDDYVGV